MLLYYITDRKGFGGTRGEQRLALLRRIAEAARAGVDYIQLREKDLPARELERLASEATRAVHDNGSARLLINGRADIALACGADGVHLPSSELPAAEVRALWRTCSTQCPTSPGTGALGISDRSPLIGISAHSLADLHQARAQGAEFAVLAPIFEKVQFSLNGIGVEALREACSALRAEEAGSSQFTVLALGGVNLTNAHACLEAGAAGVAGIRLFQSGDIFQTVRRLRGCGEPDEYG